MKWNNEEGYVIFKTADQSLRSFLGVSELGYRLNPEVSPYVTYVLSWLNKILIWLGEDIETLTYVKEVFNQADRGFKILERGGVIELQKELNISSGDKYIPGEEIPYRDYLLILVWTNVMTALVWKLKCQYAALLYTDDESGCTCPYGTGQSTEDYENWSSGVYPEDENYEYTLSSTTSWRSSSDIPECTKHLR